MKYKHIVFDVDGTLVDSELKVLSTLRQAVIDMRGVDHPVEDLGWAMAPEPILTKLGYDNVEPIIRLWERYLIEYQEPPKFFDGIEQTIMQLCARGVNVGIGTSRIYAEYLADFEKLPLYSYLGTAVCGDMVQKRKPAPDILLCYMEKTGASAADILFVGDTLFDLQCAEAAGIDAEYLADFEKLPLYSYLGTAVCGDMVQKRKPAPDILLCYMEKTGASAADILFVGDTLFDLQCAEAAGIDAALAGWGTKLPASTACAYYLKRPQELLEL